LLGEFFYYFAVIGFVQELFFRGLVYRAFEDWLGTRWAIWGSSAGFVLWHIFGWGLLAGVAMLLYGLIFALLRWRAGGILGLILIHGAMDYLGMLMLPDLDVISLGRPEIPFPAMLFLGLALILVTPVVLWRFYPRWAVGW
jgi:membrane protease YdiL (CAAX protease family)